MKFLSKGKDGGPESTVTGYWLIEVKWLFSIALLRFDSGSRDAYHSHAFNCLSWVLRGRLLEWFHAGAYGGAYVARTLRSSWIPFITRRETFHRVVSQGTTWVFTLRGPWAKQWREFDPRTGEFSTLEDGRVVVEGM